MKNDIKLTVSLAVVIILSACQTSTPVSTPTEIPLPTHTIAPSSTPMPTVTPVPTATAIPPTPTVEPPAVLSDLLTNVQVIRMDDFHDLNKWNKWNTGTGNLSNGMFELTGQAEWMSGLELKEKLSEGFGIVLKYKTIKNTDFNSEFVFATGDWETDSFRQFGVYNGKRPKADLYQGNNGIGGSNLHGNLSLKADTWYNLLMVVGKDGEFLAAVWNPTDPSQKTIYHEIIGPKWAGLSYKFQAKANINETMYIDDFMKVSFDEIKN